MAKEIKVGQVWKRHTGTAWRVITIDNYDCVVLESVLPGGGRIIRLPLWFDDADLINDAPVEQPVPAPQSFAEMSAALKQKGHMPPYPVKAPAPPWPFAGPEEPKPTVSAPAMLQQAAKHMTDRAATYDKPEGERSMAATVAAFNAITGRDLRESEGWMLLAVLKMVRSEQRDTPHQDSAEDLVAYGALYGEARLNGR